MQLVYIRQHFAGKGSGFLQEKYSVLKTPALLHCRLSCCSVLPVELLKMSLFDYTDSHSWQLSSTDKTRKRFSQFCHQQSGANTSLVLLWRMWAQKWKENKPLG